MTPTTPKTPTTRNSPAHRALARKAATQAARVLPIFEKAHPKDLRPRRAIEALRAWSQGKLELGMAKVRKLSLDSHAAARAAKTDPAKFAARAAGQAIAIWHVPNHALAVPYYTRKATAAGNDPMKTLILRTTLLVSPKARNPSVTRDIEVAPQQSLYRLASAIVAAYGFDLDHCFGFYSNIDTDFYHDSKERYELFADLDDVEPTEALSVKRNRIGTVWGEPGKKMTFLFDYGDGWRFLVEHIGSAKRRPSIRYPLVIRRKGRAPKQY